MPPTYNQQDLLLVTNPDETAELAMLFRRSGLRVFTAANCQQAREILRSGRDPMIVVSALSLKDGSWWSLRKAMIDQHSMAALVVCLPTVDGGVTDVLEAGCSAVLTPPYQFEQVRKLVESLEARRVVPAPQRKPMQSVLSEQPRQAARGHSA
jgi:DNA-binding NtrC family response regulator